MTNLPAVISTLNQQIGALTEKLEPVTEDHVARNIRSLLATGLVLPSGMQADKAPEIYAFALAGVPAFGVSKATEKLIKGEYEINRSFIPTPPEFAAIARAETKVVRDDLMRLRERKSTLEDAAKPPAKTSEEEKARIRQLHNQFKASHAAVKVTERFGNIDAPITPDQAEYWKTIGGFNDAHEITEEHKAYRRKIDQAVGLYAGGEVYSPPQGEQS